MQAKQRANHCTSAWISELAWRALMDVILSLGPPGGEGGKPSPGWASAWGGVGASWPQPQARAPARGPSPRVCWNPSALGPAPTTQSQASVFTHLMLQCTCTCLCMVLCCAHTIACRPNTARMLFVCLFVCLFACLLACLFVCLLVSGLMPLLTFICSTTRLLVCLFMFRSALLVVDSERLHVIFIEWTLRKSSLVTLMRRLHVMHAQQTPQMDKPLCRVGALAL